jgi:hypothetical protein
MHVHEIGSRKDHRGVDLISDVLPFGRLWYGESNAVSYAKFYSRSHNAVIRVYAPEGSRTVGVWEAGIALGKRMFRVVRRQPICQAAFNGEFGNSRDASVHADGAKSRCPKRVAGTLRRRNSLHMAMQIGVRACPRYRFHDCGPHSAQTEQGGQTALLTSL